MTSARTSLRGLTAIAAAALLAACAQHGAILPSSGLNPTSLSRQSFQPQIVPPKCKGQKTTKNYASITDTLATSGGSACIPAFGGFGGKVKYPAVSKSVQLTLTSSTTNYDDMPSLGSGTPIFYLQLSLSGGTTFGNKVGAGGGLTSKTIVPGDPYTVYGQAVVFGEKFNFGPCYAIATKGKYGGVLGGIGDLLKGEKISFSASGVIEVYSGQQASTEC